MDTQDFIKAVKEMRIAQRRWFGSHTEDNYLDMKRAEYVVDTLILAQKQTFLTDKHP
jgi:hypothetical protein